MPWRSAFVSILIWVGAGALRAVEFPRSPPDLKNLMLEKLLEIEVISGTRTLEQWKTTAAAIEGNDPGWMGSLRSSVNLFRRLQVDAGMRYVSASPNPRVPAYATLDVASCRVDVGENLEISLVGQNLLEPAHPEFRPSPEVRRGFSGQVAARF